MRHHVWYIEEVSGHSYDTVFAVHFVESIDKRETFDDSEENRGRETDS